TSGQKALERLQQAEKIRAYDVMLLDYRLPGLDALEALKELRKPYGPGIPVVLVAGQGEEEEALRALNFGAASYLIKNPGYLYQLPGELENAHYRAELIREQVLLSESEARNRTMLKAIPDLMFLHSKEGIYLDYHAKDPRGLFVP